MPLLKKISLLIITVLLLCISQNDVLAKGALFSEKDEIHWGQEGAEAVIKEKGLYDDQVMQDRAANVLRQLIPYVTRKKLPYQVQVIKDKEINAFTYPGGRIFVTDQLMRYISTDDELAFVLGHEMGHNENYHTVNAIERSMLGGLLTSILFRNDKDMSGIVGTVVQVSMSRGYGFKNEHQADLWGFQLATKAGYNPAAGAVFFHELQEKYGDGSQSVANFLSPHPKSSVRIENQLAYMKDFSGKRVGVSAPKTKEQTPATIYIDNKPALVIEASHNNWSAIQRAEWVAGRLAILFRNDKNLMPEGFTVKSDEDGNFSISYADSNPIITIWEEDASVAETDVQTLGFRWLNSLTSALR